MKYTFPAVIALNEIPQEGRDYTYSSEDRALNQQVTDLLGENPYHLDFHMQPIGQAFELKGHLRAERELLCSRCGINFKSKIDCPVNEILMVSQDQPRNSQSAKISHPSEDHLDSGPFCNMIESENFDVGEFLHEIIALSEPIQPLGKPDCDEKCENYIEMKARLDFLQNEEKLKQSPFAVLGKIKSSDESKA